MRFSLLLAALLLAACDGSTSPAPLPLPPLAQSEPASTLPVYGVVGNGPLVVVLADDMNDTLYDWENTTGLVSDLVGHGFTVLSLDLPCHGADATPNESPLECWSLRIHAGDNDLFLKFCSGLSEVLDHLGIQEAGIAGISRGGYMAITCAAYESRFTQIALLEPVTDLNYLAEFQEYPAPEALFNVQQYIPYLQGRPILLSIDPHDTRVGTDLAWKFAQEVGAEFQLTDAAESHELLSSQTEAAASWFNSALSTPETP